MSSVDLRPVGKRTLEWDLNDWKWDGDLFIASPLNPVPSGGLGQKFFPFMSGVPTTGGSSNSSSTSSDDLDLRIEKGKRELEKRRRVTVVEDGNLNEEVGTLSLKLGGHGYQIGEHGYQIGERDIGSWEGVSGKKTKLTGGNSSRSVCQVEDCGADLSNAKDYHRRHKVCEIHSKASRALVGNVMQRFCQQCSRFHVLQEFDEGKRSCRRRLAGHNKRRRKTNPETVANGSPQTDDQTSGYLLISLLRILSNLHSNKSDQASDQDLLSHLLRSLAPQNAEHGGRNVSGFLQESQNLLTNGTLVNNPELVATFLSKGPQGITASSKQNDTVQASEMPMRAVHANNSRVPDVATTSSVKTNGLNSPPASSELRESAAGQGKMNNFDLNDVYLDSDDGIEDMERLAHPEHLGRSSHDYPSWMQQDSHQTSPPQTSRNSDSASAHSPSSSSGEAQSRTDRIVFKLFGKRPSDFPIALRGKVLDWLSHSPTDIESYIRPGCVILTIYLRQTETEWDEVCCDLSSSLSRLLEVSNDAFWRMGWVYVRVQEQIAFIYNGQVVVDSSLHLRSNNYCRITCVKPIAVSASERAQFSVRGLNLSRPATRLLCALEGKYLTQEDTCKSTDDVASLKEQDDVQCFTFSCSIPAVNGRGFFEVEDHGLSSSFFPFIIAEEEVCSEIRVLENTLESTGMCSDAGGAEGRTQAMDFIHEMGWLLHRNQLRSRLGRSDPNTDLFSLHRFKWLMEFSMDREWCAVVKKLLDILHEGTVSSGDHPSLNLALMDMGLLHRAVRKSSRPLVELLLRYKPKEAIAENSPTLDGGNDGYLFRPDVKGPAGLTPLHIAAGKDGSEDVLDALTSDPKMVGIEAWKTARDVTGYTPEYYARLRGHFSYIHLVQKKINKRSAPAHVVVDIPSTLSDCAAAQKQSSEVQAGFEIGTGGAKALQRQCRQCDQGLAYGTAGRTLVYRPAMLSMVAIAAVCVCVALLFKTSPEVLYVFRPFRWDMLDYGTY